jgi:acetate kinase
MAASLLVFNAGSSSLKCSLYRLHNDAEPRLVAQGVIEALDGNAPLFRAQRADGSGRFERACDTATSVSGYRAAIRSVLEWAEAEAGDAPLAAAGHRVVHGGNRFGDPVFLDADTMAELDRLVPLAPLHMPRGLEPAKALTAMRPDLKQIACFDTAFHRTLPRVECMFGLPRALAEESGVRRYGFHGLSYEFIAGELRRLDPAAASGRTVAAHLGSGASLCALVNGSSVATTMGFSALDGLLMGTRCGSLDPGALLYLLRRPHQDVDSVEQMLYHQSGLLGVSGGISSDLRTLLADPRPAAKEAVALFLHRIRRELGAMVAAAGGIDALVFTGGVGEHGAPIRAAVVEDAAWLGMRLDANANSRNEQRISANDSAVRIWVVPTDENRMIARHCAALLRRG